jgi:hypothetical protein
MLVVRAYYRWAVGVEGAILVEGVEVVFLMLAMVVEVVLVLLMHHLVVL